MLSATSFATVRRAFVVALTAAAGLALTGTGVAHAGPAYYKFVVEHSGKCLDVLHGSKLHATPTHQWRCLDQVLSQRWEARRFDDGAYVFVARHSGKCLDVAFASTAGAAAVIQATCSFKANQRWRLKKNADGTYRVIAKHSGLCLDVANVDQANGARVVQARCWGGENQSWHINKVA
ncbi:RICIN domain-containing protein [Nonomuraea sp. NPDC048882]|uniref:RICIN domain-containing protein n=1 Tax=unclassified Nonomuraea TaxID=2593643 RepID=UPI0033EFF4F7